MPKEGMAYRASQAGNNLTYRVGSHFGSGTALQELYIAPEMMVPKMWDTLASVAKWANANADVLVDTHWVGGDPGKSEVDGWASWSPRIGILTLRNPDDKPREIPLDIGTAFELPDGGTREFVLAPPFADQRIQKVRVNAGSP